MKTIVTMISSLVMGALLANSNFSPLQELKHWLGNKRRFFYAIGFHAAGFVFLMTGIIAGTIEATLQYEAQGFVFWSAMSTLAFAFAGVGVLCVIVGRLVLPTFLPQSSSFSAFGANTDWSEVLEGAVQIFSDLTKMASSPKTQPAEHSAALTPEDTVVPHRKVSPDEKAFEMHH